MKSSLSDFIRILLYGTNVAEIIITIFIVILSPFSTYLWIFGNGSHMTYTLYANSIVSEGRCITDNTMDYRLCSEMLQIYNYGYVSFSSKLPYIPFIKFPSFLESSFNSLSSVYTHIHSLFIGSFVLLCLLIGYIIFLMIGTLLLIVRDRTNYNSRKISFFCICLHSLALLCLTSAVLYWGITPIIWLKTSTLTDNPDIIITRRIYYCWGYYSIITINIISSIELFIMVDDSPSKSDYEIIT